MKCEVTLYKAGTVFKEEVIAKDYQDARQVALARNPNATVVGVNAKFLNCGRFGSMHSDHSQTTEQKNMTITWLWYALLYSSAILSLTALLLAE